MTKHPIRAAAAVALLAIGLAGCSAGGSSTSAALEPNVVKDGRLTVCTDLDYKPFEFMKGDQVVGFDVDLVNEVAKKLDLEPVIINADFDAIASGRLLNEAKCDVAAAGLTITGERARVIDFSSPYGSSAQTLVVRGGSGVRSLEDLAGSSIAVQQGSTGETYVADHAPADIRVVSYKDATDVDSALHAGQVSAAVFDNTVVGDVIARNPGFAIATEFDTGEQYGMAVRKSSNVDLLRSINEVLADLKANGGYDAIYKKWFGTQAS